MSLQDNPKKSPEVFKMRPRASQELPKAAQEAPDKPQEVSRRLPDALRGPLEAPSTLKMTSTILQWTPRPLQQASERGRRQMGVSPLDILTIIRRNHVVGACDTSDAATRFNGGYKDLFICSGAVAQKRWLWRRFSHCGGLG